MSTAKDQVRFGGRTNGKEFFSSLQSWGEVWVGRLRLREEFLRLDTHFVRHLVDRRATGAREFVAWRALEAHQRIKCDFLPVERDSPHRRVRVQEQKVLSGAIEALRLGTVDEIDFATGSGSAGCEALDNLDRKSVV